MTSTAALLEELRLLRQMGEVGRTAAAKALRSARLASNPDAALKYMIHKLDSAIVDKGGTSIFAAKPRGTLSAEAEDRLRSWADETPRRHPEGGGPKTGKEGVFQGPQYKPGRLVAGMTGKLGGFVSDRDDER